MTLLVDAAVTAIAFPADTTVALTRLRVDTGTLFLEFSTFNEEHLHGKACKSKSYQHNSDQYEF